MNTATEPRFQVDHEFLEMVEAGINHALDGVTQLEAQLADLHGNSQQGWLDSFDQLTANLAGWESHLMTLTERTAAAEAELNEQEDALRTWIQMMAITSTRLAEVSASAPA